MCLLLLILVALLLRILVIAERIHVVEGKFSGKLDTVRRLRSSLLRVAANTCAYSWISIGYFHHGVQLTLNSGGCGGCVVLEREK